MSSNALQSPLGINVLGSLLQNNGITINPYVTGYIGSSTGITNYTPGTILTNTLLDKIHTAKNLAYGLLGADITDVTYRSMLSIGNGFSLALSNSNPSTYNRVINVTQTVSTNNIVICDSTENLEVNQIISFSGVAFGNLTINTLYYVSSIVSLTEFTISTSFAGPVFAQVDSTGSLTLNNLGLQRYGFIRQLALQAYEEFNYNNSLPSYNDFLGSFIQCKSFIDQTNPLIISLHNSTDFLYGVYSNMNDLITADISGVNLSTTNFGQDLIKLGKALDLSTISTFGLPSNLLLTLNKNNAVTQSLIFSLLNSGLSIPDVDKIMNNKIEATPEQEKLIYESFKLISNSDLKDILIILNCKITKIVSLDQLLDPKILFPNSYTSLTVPIYNEDFLPTNSKTYYPIYASGAINNNLISLLNNFGDYLIGILPSELYISCVAFSYSMQQITNISKIPIEKFAQIVLNLETTRDLDINSTSIPVDTSLVSSATSAIALGSGLYNTYTMGDFFGCMSGTPYNYKNIESIINRLNTNTLSTIYDSMITLLSGAGPYNAALNVLIGQANTEISNIYAASLSIVNELNSIWDSYGTQLSIEQRARYNNLIASADIDLNGGILNNSPSIQITFVNEIPQFATNTKPHMYAQTLESISDLSVVGGQSIVGLMRENRNKKRLELIGIPLNNDIPSEFTPEEEKILISNGDSNVYPNSEPYGYYDDTNKEYVITNTGFGGTTNLDLGTALEPGSLSSSVYKNIVEPNINTVYSSKQLLPSTYSVDDALNEVTLFNCECWNN